MKSKRWKVLLKLIISLVILTVIFIKIDYREILRMDIFDLKYFLLAILFVPIRLIVKAFRWQIIMRKAVPNLGFIESMKSMLVSISLGLITPMRVGQAGIFSYLESDNNLKTGFLGFFEVIMDLVMIIFTSALAFSLIFMIPACSLFQKTEFSNVKEQLELNLLYLPSYLYFLLAVFFFIIAIVSILFFAKPGQFLAFIAKFSGNKLGEFVSRFAGVELYSKREIFIITLDSIIIYFFNIVQFFFLTCTFIEVPFLVAIISFPLTMLGVCLPITIAGIGAREGVAAWIYSSFGINSAVGFKASFILFLINMVLPSIIGIVIYNLSSHESKKE